MFPSSQLWKNGNGEAATASVTDGAACDDGSGHSPIPCPCCETEQSSQCSAVAPGRAEPLGDASETCWGAGPLEKDTTGPKHSLRSPLVCHALHLCLGCVNYRAPVHGKTMATSGWCLPAGSHVTLAFQGSATQYLTWASASMWPGELPENTGILPAKCRIDAACIHGWLHVWSWCSHFCPPAIMPAQFLLALISPSW